MHCVRLMSSVSRTDSVFPYCSERKLVWRNLALSPFLVIHRAANLIAYTSVKGAQNGFSTTQATVRPRLTIFVRQLLMIRG